MELKFKLLPPTMPNFIRVDFPSTGKKEDGFGSGPSIHVGDLTEEQATEYADLMRETFIKHWRDIQALGLESSKIVKDQCQS